MDDALYYLSLNRQVGLFNEMSSIANNIANVHTPGYQRTGIAFTEFVVAAEGGDSLSMGHAGAQFTDPAPGRTEITNNRFDLAIEGPGFFLVDDPEGPVMLRGGSFSLSPEGLLVTGAGASVLDVGGLPVAIPPDATDVAIGSDGTISARGEVISQLAVVDAPSETMSRVDATAFRAAEGFDPVPNPGVRQGALERSNVDPVVEIARMIEVQRAYEAVQSVIADEDRRINDVITTLRQTA